MNCLNKDKQAKIIAALVEGNSLRTTARMCDVAFNTVLKLLPELLTDSQDATGYSAMEAATTDHVWDAEEIAALLDPK